MMDDNSIELYQKLGEITETLTSIGNRIERVEAWMDKQEAMGVLSTKMESVQKDLVALDVRIKVLESMPGKFLWVIVAAFAAGIGSIVLEFLK